MLDLVVITECPLAAVEVVLLPRQDHPRIQ